MKRVRLDMGAVSASSIDEGSFVFLLYKDGMDVCLPVEISPPEMHAILSNFKKIEEEDVSTQQLMSKTLKAFRIELLEVVVIRSFDNKRFASRLMFFDGDNEITKDGSFIDGMILAKEFSCPIYTSEEIMEKFSTNVSMFPDDKIKTESQLERLKEQLSEAINVEDYEKAARITKEIEKFNL